LNDVLKILQIIIEPNLNLYDTRSIISII